MHHALANPFFQFAGSAEHAPVNSAAVSQGQACEAAAEFCESPLEPAMAGDAAAGPGLTVSPVPAAEFPRGFDPERFFEAIEPLPLFLQAPIEAIEILARWA